MCCRWLLGLLLLFVGQTGRAEELKIRDVFKQMPVSVMPYLSENNRLDFIDFIDSDMKAIVKNRLGGSSEMVSLTDSTLSIRMSSSLQVDLLLLKVEGHDTRHQIICLIETFGSDSLSLESNVRFFNLSWESLNEPPLLSESFKNIISMKKVQTILKKDDEILKKN